MIGYPDGTWKPYKNVSRAEAAAMINSLENSLGIEIPYIRADSRFSDVNKNDWYYPFVNKIYRQGIIAGYPDGTYKPDNTVSIAELMTIIYKVMKDDSNAKIQCNNIVLPKSTPSWAKPFLEDSLKRGIFTSDSNCKIKVLEEICNNYDSCNMDMGINRLDAGKIIWDAIKNHIAHEKR